MSMQVMDTDHLKTCTHLLECNHDLVCCDYPVLFALDKVDKVPGF